MNIWQVLATIGVVVTLTALMISTYLLNKKTPRPEGCEPQEGCQGCSELLCSNHPQQNEKEKEKWISD